ncbi:hypothetical protein [Deinococcus aquaedulcis]|uniref:hypothetical protein n=1 Tax=Deinococcus aquaedulcis TaxID=2840455 RepID=UPI001C8398D1|nr:hypothetical protein [Deinococcus aquaedulcis]
MKNVLWLAAFLSGTSLAATATGTGSASTATIDTVTISGVPTFAFVAADFPGLATIAFKQAQTVLNTKTNVSNTLQAKVTGNMAGSGLYYVSITDGAYDCTTANHIGLMNTLAGRQITWSITQGTDSKTMFWCAGASLLIPTDGLSHVITVNATTF